MSDIQYIDHRWYGPPAAMDAALAGVSNVIGPIVLDGVAYATVRSETLLPLPAGLGEIGPNLSSRLMGVWMGDVPDVPPIVSNFQGRTALRYAGLFDAANSAVDDMAREMEEAGDVMGAETLREAWVRASFERASPLAAQIATRLNLTEEQMNDLFRSAGNIQV